MRLLGRWLGLLLGALVPALCTSACVRCEGSEPETLNEPPPSAAPIASPAPPQILHLPDSGDTVLGSPWPLALTPDRPVGGGTSDCPAEMVAVRGRFCIDRWEVSLVDMVGHRRLSPHYPPAPQRARQILAEFGAKQQEPPGSQRARMALPPLQAWQLSSTFEVQAESSPGVLPSGYLDADTAENACRRAGKRLCTAEEWLTACRGQEDSQFPYGTAYEPGACNVFREAHPAQILYGDASRGHLDPRLNLVTGEKGPLLRATGKTPRCRSRWGDDAIYDMVGNLDEWVDDPQGEFRGGFYSRSTRQGCEASIKSHPRVYLDYSLGVRCCRGFGGASRP